MTLEFVKEINSIKKTRYESLNKTFISWINQEENRKNTIVIGENTIHFFLGHAPSESQLRFASYCIKGVYLSSTKFIPIVENYESLIKLLNLKPANKTSVLALNLPKNKKYFYLDS